MDCRLSSGPASVAINDPYSLERFVKAQSDAYDRACAELRRGRKQTHWIWYIFPQLKGLGYSDRSQYYGISSLAEAEAYLAHPILGQRLLEATNLVLRWRDRPLQDILGSPDDVKFISSMTLFSRAVEPRTVFAEALDVFAGGHPDARTLLLLGKC